VDDGTRASADVDNRSRRRHPVTDRIRGTHDLPRHPPDPVRFCGISWPEQPTRPIVYAPDCLRHVVAYSHSIVPGGLLVTSSTTRLTSGTSLVMRVEILASTSYGTRVQSAVIASSEDTGRSTIG